MKEEGRKKDRKRKRKKNEREQGKGCGINRCFKTKPGIHIFYKKYRDFNKE